MFWTGCVKAWDKAAAKGWIKCDREQCEGCGRTPDEFVCCELRVKTFLVLFGGLVYDFQAITLRWKCPFCGYRFTMQPPWGLPRKRYVKGVILSRCWRYLKEAGSTYRSLVSGTGYWAGGGKIDERRPSHSRVWHWLKDLGEMVSVLDRVKRLIFAKSGKKAVDRVFLIAHWKYRSPRRHSLLQAAHSLLQLRPEWFRFYPFPYPPIFGTPSP
jgi:hypothetical protein